MPGRDHKGRFVGGHGGGGGGGTGIHDKDTGWAKFFENAHKLEHAGSVKVGVLADTEQGGLHAVDEQGKAAALTVAEIAVVNEFGTEDEHVPARPFLRPTFDAERERLAKVAEHYVGEILDGKISPVRALGLLGLDLASAVKRRIQAGVSPANAPSTALRKAGTGRTKGLFGKAARTLGRALAQVGALASVKPLIDTGRLLNAVTHVVEPGSKHSEEKE